MEKMKTFLGQSLVPTLLTLLTIRFIAIGGNFGEALALLVIGAIFCYEKFVDKVSDNKYSQFTKDIDDLKGAVNAVRVSQGLKRVDNSPPPKITDNTDAQKKRYF